MTYPELQDASVVNSYPPLKGIEKNLVFFHHTHHEVKDNDIMQQGEGSLSKVNTFEQSVVTGM